MINNYFEITGKYLRSNKKRTLLTIIGIILSMSLISSIGFFIVSIQEVQIQDVKNHFGSWHLIYEDPEDSLITKITSNPNVLRSGICTIGDVISINDQLSGREIFGSGDGFNLLHYKLTEGRYPVEKKEVAMEKWFIERIKADGKIGDKIKVLDKEYTLVGILNNTYQNQNQGIGELLTIDKSEEKGKGILLVELNQNRRLKENIDELKTLNSEGTVLENELLIIAQGKNLPYDMIIGLIIIIGIVVISTVAVIYNAFQISVVERVKQFGLLRAVGATPKQIRRIILREATFLAFIGIPIGLCFGVVALYGIDLAFRLIGGEDVVLLSPVISINVIGISILIGLISIYVSALLPAIFAGRISPLIAISSRNSITKEKFSRGKNYIIEWLFDFEGSLAMKNIKRNRKRYRITVFSIIISVTLFISFTTFMNLSLNVYSEMNESSNIHFLLIKEGYNQQQIGDNIIEEINNLPYTDVSYKIYNSYHFDAVIDKTRELKEIKAIENIYNDINYMDDNMTLLEATLVVYDDKSFEVAQGYLNEGNINIDKLNEENGVIIIGKNRIYNEKTQRTFYGPVTDLKVGDEIYLQLNESSSSEDGISIDFGKGEVNKVKVMAVLERNPFNFRGKEDQVKIITTGMVAEGLTSKKIEPIGLDIKIKDVKLENLAMKNIERIMDHGESLKLINFIDKNRSTKSIILMIKLLLYGFVVVVTLIGSVNIINTITTNVILRRREFGVLKSIGLTQKGLRKMITLEGFLYGIMGSIYGSVFGSALSYLLYKAMNGIREQPYQFPLKSIIIATAGAMLIGYLSVLSPIRRMKKDNLIDVVREDF